MQFVCVYFYQEVLPNVNITECMVYYKKNEKFLDQFCKHYANWNLVPHGQS